MALEPTVTVNLDHYHYKILWYRCDDKTNEQIEVFHSQDVENFQGLLNALQRFFLRWNHNNPKLRMPALPPPQFLADRFGAHYDVDLDMSEIAFSCPVFPDSEHVLKINILLFN